MAVSDVKRGSLSPISLGKPPTNASGSEPVQGDVAAVDAAADTLSIRPAVFSQRSRIKINSAIEATNVATGAIEDISRFISGIEGIVEQASTEEIPPQRREKLQKEADGLREEILKAAARTTNDGLKPLAGDKIRVEVEETLGKALEIILPNEAEQAFGLGAIRLDKKEFILDTVANIERARRGVEELRNKLSKGVDSIEQTVSALEIARENREAASASIRDVNEALKVAHETREGIRGFPLKALGSISALEPESAELLR